MTFNPKSYYQRIDDVVMKWGQILDENDKIIKEIRINNVSLEEEETNDSTSVL